MDFGFALVWGLFDYFDLYNLLFVVVWFFVWCLFVLCNSVVICRMIYYTVAL